MSTSSNSDVDPTEIKNLQVHKKEFFGPLGIIQASIHVITSAKFEQVVFFFLILHLTCAINFSREIHRKAEETWPQLRRNQSATIFTMVKIICYLYAVFYPITAPCLWAYAHFISLKTAGISKRPPKIDDDEDVEGPDTAACPSSATATTTGKDDSCTFTVRKRAMLPVHVPTSSGGERVSRAVVDESEGGTLMLRWLDVINDESVEEDPQKGQAFSDSEGWTLVTRRRRRKLPCV
ncbi:hypothetical protein QBC44DRAFT_309222 [Cladorrhinum sp. PSN332]|nr:hypothetical protein QBC44DRAFT_309222 [Cladorrhinum sp. PSN332]